MDAQIEKALEAFRRALLDPLPGILREESATFIVCMNIVAAVDALSGWRYGSDGDRFGRFVRAYFPANYAEHAPRLYRFRCRALHNFSPAHFTLVHRDPDRHLQLTPLGNGDRYLCATTLLSDFRGAAQKFIAEVEESEKRQAVMLARLKNVREGGGVAVARG